MLRILIGQIRLYCQPTEGNARGGGGGGEEEKEKEEREEEEEEEKKKKKLHPITHLSASVVMSRLVLADIDSFLRE